MYTYNLKVYIYNVYIYIHMQCIHTMYMCIYTMYVYNVYTMYTYIRYVQYIYIYIYNVDITMYIHCIYIRYVQCMYIYTDNISLYTYMYIWYIINSTIHFSLNHSFLKSALRSGIFRGPLPWLGAAVALPGIFFLSQLLCSWVGRGALQALHIWPTTKTWWKYLKYPEAGTLCALNHLSYTEPSNSVFFQSLAILILPSNLVFL